MSTSGSRSSSRRLSRRSPVGRSSRRIRSRPCASGTSSATTTRSRGPRRRPARCSSRRRSCAAQTIIRLAIGNERTTEADIRRAWEVLRPSARVIFDLWETLIDWNHDANARMHAQVRERVGFDFHERWSRATERYTDTGAHRCSPASAFPPTRWTTCMSYRAEFVRTCLVPREGAVETLAGAAGARASRSG